MRIRLDLAYDGSGFHGWATQPGLRTVQGTVETALATVLRLSEPPRLTCAGRTDAGVHARGQVAHVDLSDGLVTETGTLARRLRRLLPADVTLRSAAPAPPGFDARFSAIERRYVYRLCDDPAAVDPWRRGEIVGWSRRLDDAAMNAAGRALLGEHDFAAFCRRRDGASTIRTLRTLATSREGALLSTEVHADAFCHSMVRSLLGALVAIGEHRYDPGWAGEILAGRVRDPRVRVMPAHGLVLDEVRYPADVHLSARAHQARRRRDL